jgi:glutamate synthase domain-containing protein 2/glutamate synthase domain-containing protein 1/glutamate synthase domain-containing protein 3
VLRFCFLQEIIAAPQNVFLAGGKLVYLRIVARKEFFSRRKEFSSCGVGFVAGLDNQHTHQNLQLGLRALANLEHRGGTSPDGLAGDGAGLLTDIPRELLGIASGDAVASLFLPRSPKSRVQSLKIFEETFRHSGLEVYDYRDVPFRADVLSPDVRASRPDFLMAFIRQPDQCSTRYQFEKLLYGAKQLTRSRLREAGILKQFFFTSLSAGTIVYKGLTPSDRLADLFPDLKDPRYRTRFSIFHRRFSTNTATAWDTAQPFRVVAHNGEINTISGNRSWAYSRERALGLREDELLTHRGISDSGSVNEMIEALLFRSSIPHPEDILAILMPKAHGSHSYYKFWSRAMEPWDGPALFTFSDARTIGARLDRSGFRPCRWARTDTHFYLSSEAGSFEIPESEIRQKGHLSGGSSLTIHLSTGTIHFRDPSEGRENRNATFDPRVAELSRLSSPRDGELDRKALELYGYTEEDVKRLIEPLVRDGKEAIGSMGDTARVAVLSAEPRSLYDFFYQRFAQVTNPPLDYLREKIVTDMSVILGRKPNIFEPKEMVPLKLGIQLPGPIVSLAQLEFLKGLEGEDGFAGAWPASRTLDTTFDRALGLSGWLDRIESLKKEVVAAIKERTSIFILSDRSATRERPAIPALLALVALTQELNHRGLRLRVSFVIDSGEVREIHHAAVLTGFGAAAVCPYVPLQMARAAPADLFGAKPIAGTADQRELKVVAALEAGLLKVMSKMGISVFRSYQGAELFTILGFSDEVHAKFFPAHESVVGGLGLHALTKWWLRDLGDSTLTRGPSGRLHNYLYQEHPREPLGEKHSMTIQEAKRIHRLVSGERKGEPLTRREPVSFRHLLAPKASPSPLPLDRVMAEGEVLRTFGSGAMSFGAISAEAQRDLFLAMKEVGGRSNSGEGGENPYYFTDGVTAHTKQIASGRFGVTAEYLITGEEIQIKIAQGAKPGEGGQLMAAKVSADIARARHSDTGVDLISPPPMHDIYSIEDLKQLIYELRQLKPEARVSVKLVAGENIGAIAVGVAKAGADIIQISGHDGGTGAASLGSMKHAGLPWELGLAEVHRTLSAQKVRGGVTLRVDGGLASGRDVVTAALLGADEFDFGKLLLVAEGCIMARVCEKNTCPTGIATHDPKFKRLYRGSKDRVVALLRHLAGEVREELSKLGAATLAEIVGRADLLEVDPRHRALVEERGLDLGYLLGPAEPVLSREPSPFAETVSDLNVRILKDAEAGQICLTGYAIRPADRAVPATLNGEVARQRTLGRAARLTPVELSFRGSAGQGFGVFLEDGLALRLYGEANDSAGKSMSGGRMVIVPSPEATFTPESNTLIGNCALYGATGGVFYARGVAGNRFAVRNSGALAVVEGVGMHACEYMTRGTVVVLGHAGANVGAGMTGGTLYLRADQAANLNAEYVRAVPCSEDDLAALATILTDYHRETGSQSAADWLTEESGRDKTFVKCVPLRQAASQYALDEAQSLRHRLGADGEGRGKADDVVPGLPRQ